MTLPLIPHTLPEAIARMEGFYAMDETPNRPQRNHNPGDIEYGVFTRAHGATGGDPRFAIFPNDEIGFQCLQSLLAGSGYRTLTVMEAINRYAPPSENNTVNYVTLVCAWCQCQPTDIVGDLLNASSD